MEPMKELREYFTEIMRLRYIAMLLDWDTQVYMPSGASKGRSEQTALLEGIYHNKLVSDKTLKIIKSAEKVPNPSIIEAAMLREAKRIYEKAVKLPLELVKEIAKTATLGHKTWEKAREKSDFQIFKPVLEKMVSLKQQEADKIDIGPTRYDTLMDYFEPGAKSNWISKIFNELKPNLNKIIKKLESSTDKPNQDILKKKYDAKKQWDLSIEITRLRF
jgi:carboxypeptidase Taq